MIILITMAVLNSKACQEKSWRTHKILCCNKGSAIKSSDGKWVWMQQRPLICVPLQSGAVGEKMATLSLVAVIHVTVFCVACHTYYGIS